MNTNKERKPMSKKMYITLIVCIAAAIVAIITVSLAVGLTRNPDTPTPPGSGIEVPDDPDLNDDADKPDVPDDDDQDDNDDSDMPDDDDEPTITEPEYTLPMSNCVLGSECSLDELVWSNTLHWYSTHNGADFTAEEGAAVGAIHDGEVTSVGYTTQDGYTVSIAQTDGHTAVYKSLSADIAVEVGDIVAMGDVIGYVSDSMASEQNDGPHLHLEILDSVGNFVDPMTLLGEASEK